MGRPQAEGLSTDPLEVFAYRRGKRLSVTNASLWSHIISIFSTEMCAPIICIDEEEEYPLATKIIRNCSYIDDFAFSVPTAKEAYEARTQLISLMQKGGFELRKWSSNEPSLLADLPEFN
ncbi:hypothetical protein JTB14_007246 [Gonioctena quinquepunctata]|nr:hypothetical protein JTB14_007246 [Gonioctena quinquepunctata]